MSLRGNISFRETDTGLVIGDLTIDILKHAVDGTDRLADITGTALTEVDRGLYSLVIDGVDTRCFISVTNTKNGANIVYDGYLDPDSESAKIDLFHLTSVLHITSAKLFRANTFSLYERNSGMADILIGTIDRTNGYVAEDPAPALTGAGSIVLVFTDIDDCEADNLRITFQDEHMTVGRAFSWSIPDNFVSGILGTNGVIYSDNLAPLEQIDSGRGGNRNVFANMQCGGWIGAGWNLSSEFENSVWFRLQAAPVDGNGDWATILEKPADSDVWTVDPDGDMPTPAPSYLYLNIINTNGLVETGFKRMRLSPKLTVGGPNVTAMGVNIAIPSIPAGGNGQFVVMSDGNVRPYSHNPAYNNGIDYTNVDVIAGPHLDYRLNRQRLAGLTFAVCGLNSIGSGETSMSYNQPIPQGESISLYISEIVREDVTGRPTFTAETGTLVGQIDDTGWVDGGLGPGADVWASALFVLPTAGVPSGLLSIFISDINGTHRLTVPHEGYAQGFWIGRNGSKLYNINSAAYAEPTNTKQVVDGLKPAIRISRFANIGSFTSMTQQPDTYPTPVADRAVTISYVDAATGNFKQLVRWAANATEWTIDPPGNSFPIPDDAFLYVTTQGGSEDQPPMNVVLRPEPDNIEHRLLIRFPEIPAGVTLNGFVGFDGKIIPYSATAESLDADWEVTAPAAIRKIGAGVRDVDNSAPAAGSMGEQILNAATQKKQAQLYSKNLVGILAIAAEISAISWEGDPWPAGVGLEITPNELATDGNGLFYGTWPTAQYHIIPDGNGQPIVDTGFVGGSPVNMWTDLLGICSFHFDGGTTPIPKGRLILTGSNTPGTYLNKVVINTTGAKIECSFINMMGDTIYEKGNIVNMTPTTTVPDIFNAKPSTYLGGDAHNFANIVQRDHLMLDTLIESRAYNFILVGDFSDAMTMHFSGFQNDGEYIDFTGTRQFPDYSENPPAIPVYARLNGDGTFTWDPNTEVSMNNYHRGLMLTIKLYAGNLASFPAGKLTITYPGTFYTHTIMLDIPQVVGANGGLWETFIVNGEGNLVVLGKYGIIKPNTITEESLERIRRADYFRCDGWNGDVNPPMNILNMSGDDMDAAKSEKYCIQFWNLDTNDIDMIGYWSTWDGWQHEMAPGQIIPPNSVLCFCPDMSGPHSGAIPPRILRIDALTTGVKDFGKQKYLYIGEMPHKWGSGTKYCFDKNGMMRAINLFRPGGLGDVSSVY